MSYGDKLRITEVHCFIPAVLAMNPRLSFTSVFSLNFFNNTANTQLPMHSSIIVQVHGLVYCSFSLEEITLLIRFISGSDNPQTRYDIQRE